MSVKMPILSQVAMSVTTAVYCGVAEETSNRACYIYKDNKLTQTVNCKYDHTEGASYLYNFRYVAYTAKAFSKIEIASDYDEASDVITLNSKSEIEQYRHPKTKKIVGDESTRSGRDTLAAIKTSGQNLKFAVNYY